MFFMPKGDIFKLFLILVTKLFFEQTYNNDSFKNFIIKKYLISIKLFKVT